ncbi:SurA N-terminal domain-containing protein [Rhodococcus sp. HM1]|uniref:SurA N-terminal domain-containing protein n=1 Tax=Rhodococcus sp. HM1 TaxID=2937759 RepID=UPI00200B4B21|nr:SurA N-terminal domain-containing protein [Rhodococcus sp. HM1]MCK8673953.1 SurA N-terminal domain-containing protein [Rhodococcus sp. HM1]
MVFTTTEPRIGTRAFPWVPIFHLAPDGTVTPWNRRARILTPRTPQQQARRRVIAQVVFGVIAVALVLVAVSTVLGATSGTIRTVGIAVLVVCALAVLGVVGSILEATGWITRRK